MRVFSGGIATETNTFAPMPTGMASFRDRGYYPAGTHPDRMFYFAGPLWAARLRGKPKGWDLVEGMVAGAQPSGTTTRATYEALREEMLADLKAALPVDMVLLGLHGAMVAEGYDDCEGDLLQRVRAIVGPKVVIGAELDPHSHLTPAMVDNADLLIAYKEYPHTDVLERALELVDLCAAQVEGRVKPVAAMVDCDMIVTVHTSREPARSFVDRLMAMEGKDGVLSISVAHGFAWGDVPEMGTKVLVYSDGDEAKAKAVARRVADELIGMRDQLLPVYTPIDDAIDQALAAPGGPVVISDGADNPGGGAASDATFFLRRLVERGIGGAGGVAIGPFWDPVAARIAIEAGEGARLMLRIGGKVSPLSGDPIDLECTVKAVRPEHRQTGLSNTVTDMGDSALVESAGIDILLVSLRNQAMGTDLFTGIGCDLAAKKIVVVKSSQHFHASYSKIAREVIYADAPGAVTRDLTTLPYRKVRRPKWPLET
jgi:microcystin degradation protein MlrC